jgi:SAM-dependent methyltransferase
MSEKRIAWLHPLPRAAAVDREDTLVETAQGKRTVHVGFVDDHLLEARLAAGTWLHARLDAAASSLVGLDVAADGVTWAREHGYEAHVVDAQSAEAVRGLGLAPADVVIAGEVIEHLDAPGPFFRAMRELVGADGRLVVTTPNQANFIAWLVPVTGREAMHPDHMVAFSPRTLQAIGERNGWELERVRYYQHRNEPIRFTAGPGDLVQDVVLRLVRGLFTLLGKAGLPYWSDGLIAWYRPARPEGPAA